MQDIYKDEIERLKEELHMCIEESSNLTDKRVIRKSQELDMMMNKSQGVLIKSGDLNSGN